MKNLHVLPTDKPTRLWTNNLRRRLELDEFPERHPTNIAKHIYITSDEDINENDYIITQDGRLVQVSYLLSKDLEGASKVILTTDPDLIKDSVQAIPDEFLEWFVKNPSCKEVEVMTDAFTVKEMSMLPLGTRNLKYKIIIPQEEPKQETLEEAIKQELENHFFSNISEIKQAEYFINFGAKWQQEQDKKMYSEEDILNALHSVELKDNKNYSKIYNGMKEYLKQFKKK